MPAIADGARRDGAAFFWHLGDLRAIYKIDEDFANEQQFRTAPPPSMADYLQDAWTDFAQHQITPFGQMPFYLGIGNHETIPPKTLSQFRFEFRSLLDRPELHAQRAHDVESTPVIPHTAADQTYFHWVSHGVDFINLDNASGDAFDDAQLAWFDAVLAADLGDISIRSIVVGMHEALPYSKSDNHSMCRNTSGVHSGLHVYLKLVEAQRSKLVYVLASHSHYYLADIFNTPHWQDAGVAGAVLPGWVVGTAGAERNPLPPETSSGPDAREHAYGYLLGTVTADGNVTFAFRELTEKDLQRLRSDDLTENIVKYCVENNPTLEAMHAKTSGDNQCDRHAAH